MTAPNRFQIGGSTALVTGGASGIGLATAHRLSEHGATVVVGDVAEQRVDGFTSTKLDVTSPSDWDRCLSEHPTLQIVHLNAGVSTLWPQGERPEPRDVRLLQLDLNAIRRVLAVNVEGVILGVRSVIPAIAAAGGGVIVVTASLAGVSPLPADPLYAATKHAVVGLVRSLAPTLEDLGIRIHAVCPGVVDTPMLDERSRIELTEAGFPIMSPLAIADAVVQAVLSDESGVVWLCQPGRPIEPFRFHRIPAARRDDGTPVLPPGALAD